jgi:hypothetical protein
MNKRMMLLALALAALFALPAAASAEEIHVDNVTMFTGHSGSGSLTAKGEPTFSCNATAVTGQFDAGSTTTGAMHLTLTGCEGEFLFFRVGCNTSGSPSKTINTDATFHLITFVNSKGEKRPAILVTLATTNVICAGFSNVTLSGTMIGTITSPACGAEGSSLKLLFNSNNTSTQEHLAYTGVNYDLAVTTAGEPPVTAGLTTALTLTSATKGKLTCT